MEILFVASKLADVNAYSAIAKKAGLNPVIMDVRCFTLKNAHDNTKYKSITDKGNSAILELGIDENYIMIIHNNIPVITDIFLRPQEKQHLLEVISDQIPTEADAVVRRYAMQVKQAITDYESKYENKITSIQVVSSLKNISFLLPAFKKNLPTTGFINFDPLQNVGIPSYNSEKFNNDNKSPLASVLGLAYRKLDVFGYYKFVTAVKNINLLPNRDAVRQQNKLKFLSGFAFKGAVGAIAGIYLILTVLIVSCSDSNDYELNPIPECWEFPTLTGEPLGPSWSPVPRSNVWNGEDGEMTVKIVFNDGNGTITTNSGEDSETFTEFNWQSNDSLIRRGTINVSGITSDYEFQTCDRVNIINWNVDNSLVIERE
jgi:hypothetical protein